jgi:hypothetical protein
MVGPAWAKVKVRMKMDDRQWKVRCRQMDTVSPERRFYIGFVRYPGLGYWLAYAICFNGDARLEQKIAVGVLHPRVRHWHSSCVSGSLISSESTSSLRTEQEGQTVDSGGDP